MRLRVRGQDKGPKQVRLEGAAWADGLGGWHPACMGNQAMQPRLYSVGLKPGWLRGRQGCTDLSVLQGRTSSFVSQSLGEASLRVCVALHHRRPHPPSPHACALIPRLLGTAKQQVQTPCPCMRQDSKCDQPRAVDHGARASQNAFCWAALGRELPMGMLSGIPPSACPGACPSGCTGEPFHRPQSLEGTSSPWCCLDLWV